MKKSIFKSSILIVVIASVCSCNSTDTTLPEKVDIIDAVFASGHTMLENEYQVTANTEGYLVTTKVVEGDTISVGMPLFQLSNEVQNEQLINAQVTYQDALQNVQADAPEQVQIRLQIQQAQSQLELDENNMKRYAKLVKTGAVSQLDYDKILTQYEHSKHQVEIHQKSLNDLTNRLKLNLSNSETQLKIQQEGVDDYFLSSNITGVVLQVFKKQGDLVKKGEPLAKIGGGKPMAKLLIAEEDINRIQLGQKVAISLNTDRENLKQATISRIYPAFDDIEQSFICEAIFDVEEKLYANTQLQANIIVDEKQQAMVIPSEYLLEGDSVITEDGTSVTINIGIRNNEWVEVLSGLDGSEVIKKVKGI
ncbi:MAG: efflux RND transporter periplasmic adaptor subunit [Bacteroidota bacterium]